jgi:ATP-dependent Clp protease ATP-binding subunit ClpB
MLMSLQLMTLLQFCEVSKKNMNLSRCRITDDAIIAAVNLSSRYITDRYLPDKAVDLIDESASYLKIALENMPPILQETHAKIMKLEIEREALKKETTTKAKDRLKDIEKEIADLREQTSEIELKWKNEKEILTDIKTIQKELETLRLKLNLLKPELISEKPLKFAMAAFHSLKKIWKRAPSA